jgi:catechol-2,3-dioxygenase
LRRQAASAGALYGLLFPDKPYKLAYCEDPFGNIIELYTHSTEQIWSNR